MVRNRPEPGEQMGVYLGTSLRTRPVAQTLRLAVRSMPLLGISRITDVTRMDRLGLPVWVSVRPRGRTLRVHAGKGVHAADAQVGALMEAVEYAVAESASAGGPDGMTTYGALADALPAGLDWAHFAPRVGVHIERGQRVASMRCEDLGRRRPVLLPAELVCMPADDAWGPAMFGWSTNGLASGNTLEEATLHGLLEVLERDAWALSLAQDRSQLVPGDSLPSPFDAWSAQWKGLGVELIVRHVPNDFGLPCFQAYLYEASSFDVALTAGWGLHPDRGVAVARAVCEAAQSRLSIIHGGRDDITGVFDHYRRDPQAHATAARLAENLRDRTRQTAFDAVEAPAFESTAPAPMLAELLARLAARGFSHVFRRRMRAAEPGRHPRGLHVVKVVVPGCETSQGVHPRMGPRLLARVLTR